MTITERFADIVIDIETRRPPADSPAWAMRAARISAEPVEAPSNYKDAEKIAAYIADKSATRLTDALDKAPLDPTLGMIACIAYAINDGEVQTIGDFDNALTPLDAEGEILLSLAAALYDVPRYRLIAHNGPGFDAPFIQARALVHLAIARRAGATDAAATFSGLVAMLGKLGGKPWDSPMIDTAALWPTCGYGASKGSAKLSDVCAALGIERAPSIASADVPEAWERGDREAVRVHVVADVVELREVWRILRAAL